MWAINTARSDNAYQIQVGKHDITNLHHLEIMLGVLQQATVLGEQVMVEVPYLQSVTRKVMPKKHLSSFEYHIKFGGRLK